MGWECDGATTGWGRLHWLWHLYPLCLLGMHSFPYIPCFVCLWWAHSRGKRYAGANYRIKMRHFVREKVREKSSGAFTVGFLSINLSADYPWRWGAKCHANSSEGPEKEPVPSPTAAVFCQLRIACRLRQMPQLINALPLAQQLSNKQDISVGLLSVFCVTEREREGGPPKYSKPIRWDPVYTSCSFIWCFWNADFPLSFTSVDRLILKALMEERVNNLAASST